jgi:hypothetical protein
VKIGIKDSIIFELPDSWSGRAAITASSVPGVSPVWSTHLSSEPLIQPMDAPAYAQAQGNVLKANLSSFNENRFFEFTESERTIPVREYSWKNENQEIFQCQAYFVFGSNAWTLTVSSGSDDYAKLRISIPDLLRGVRDASLKDSL